jgi:hypothetical protein
MKNYNIIISDTLRIKKIIEKDAEYTLKNCDVKELNAWLKIMKKAVKPYKIFEPFNNYFINYAHTLAIQINPIAYSKL